MTPFVVWLVIQLSMPGHRPVTIEDSVQPDLPTCWAKAAAAVDKAKLVTGAEPFEFAAQCSIQYPGEDPA